MENGFLQKMRVLENLLQDNRVVVLRGEVVKPRIEHAQKNKSSGGSALQTLVPITCQTPVDELPVLGNCQDLTVLIVHELLLYIHFLINMVAES